MKKIFLIGLLLVLFFISVNAVEVAIDQPLEGQEFTSGEIIEVTATITNEDEGKTGFEIFVKSQCEGGLNWNILSNEKIPDFTGETSVNTTFDSTQTTGNCVLMVSANYMKQGGGYGNVVEYVQVLFNPLPEEPDSKVTVVRNSGNFYYKGMHTLNFAFYPHEEITGLIIREIIPEKFYIVDELMDAIAEYKGFEWTFTESTRTLKMLFTDSVGIESDYFWIKLYPKQQTQFEPQEQINFEGDWEVLESSGNIIGKEFMTVAGFNMPECPMNDQDLLSHVDKWAKMKLSSNEIENDQIILQIIELWKGCQ